MLGIGGGALPARQRPELSLASLLQSRKWNAGNLLGETQPLRRSLFTRYLGKVVVFFVRMHSAASDSESTLRMVCGRATISRLGIAGTPKQLQGAAPPGEFQDWGK